MEDHSALKWVGTAAPVRKLVADNIRSAIIAGKFAPGARLKEQELMAWTGVSRTAVREALRQLEAEGVVGNIPNKGPVVAQVTPEEARCHYEVRAALESLVARTAASRVTEGDIEKLRALELALRSSYENGSVEEMLVVKNQLDKQLLGICANDLLTGFLDVIHARLSYLRPLVLSQPARLQENVDEITLLIEAIVARKPDAAATAALSHVQKGASATLALLRANSSS